MLHVGAGKNVRRPWSVATTWEIVCTSINFEIGVHFFFSIFISSLLFSVSAQCSSLIQFSLYFVMNQSIKLLVAKLWRPTDVMNMNKSPTNVRGQKNRYVLCVSTVNSGLRPETTRKWYGYRTATQTMRKSIRRHTGSHYHFLIRPWSSMSSAQYSIINDYKMICNCFECGMRCAYCAIVTC